MTGSIVNSGTITVSGAQFIDIMATFGGAAGSITNGGTITANGSGFIAIVSGFVEGAAAGIQVDTGPEPATGLIVNSGTITASHTGVVGLPGGQAVGILAGGILGLGSADIAGVTNSGTITASAPRGTATGISLATHTIAGGVTNSGTIIATGALSGIGIKFADLAPDATIAGGITNTGTIVGSTAAIDLATAESFGAPHNLHGLPTTINQRGGALIGSVLGAGNSAGDVLNFSGGQIILSPTQSISGFSTFNQTGGTLVLGVAPGGFASVNVGAATLGGTLQLVPSGNLAALAAAPVTFKDIAYVHTHIDGFSETGGFGALTTTAADADSLQTILGARLSTRLTVSGLYGPMVPELRVGWAHEFLDAALVNAPGSAFSATGANFGRESALVGAGLTQKVNAATRLFVDYDGRFTGGFQEHAFSAGLRVSF